MLVFLIEYHSYLEFLYLFTHNQMTVTNTPLRSACRARSVRMMFRPKRVIFGLYPATPEMRSRNSSSSFPAPSHFRNQNPISDVEVPQPRTTLNVPPSSFAPSSRGRSESLSPIPVRKCPRISNITDPSRTLPPTPSLPTIAPSNFNSNSCFVNSSTVTPRKIVVCIGLLVFSAMHVRTNT